MRSISVVFLFVVSVLTSLAQAPEEIVSRFVDALNAKNFDVMSKLVKGASISENVKKMLSNDKMPEMKVQKLVPKISGATATVTAMVGSPNVGVEFKSETVRLVANGKSWLLVYEKTNNGNINGMVGMCIDSALVFGQAKEAALGTVCLSNLKQLCMGAIMLSIDNDDLLKLTAANWKSKIMPYVKMETIFHCKFGPSKDSAYSFNSALAGKNLSEISSPATTVMLYEGKAGKFTFHPDGKTSVGFADGGVKRLTATEAKKLRWKP